ncbi:nitroreductase family deazaflavin-dependent oxidoreductase [Isoptericola sp. 4D.3]|uniref:Nitroreductase family deazaflavin-dependent oxidoreductase n=1 Tax=Isoptericola peretonis TaxID=2918523 RepID=A0ABT0J3C6_9MICO|nr:nitroreductase family deazaflavin-dependent oxidoreductase [Isoptericola sp. 4D.3]
MTSTPQSTKRPKGTPGALSLWFQRRANVSTAAKIRRKGGRMMGMDLLVLHTVGRRTGEARENPLAWFDDGEGGRLVVASGGGTRHPGWFANLAAHPDQVAVELHGAGTTAVTPHVLDDAERARVWPAIAAAAPTIDKHQRKSDRPYPVVRLVPAEA